MPFAYYKNQKKRPIDGPCRDFEAIDEIILTHVLPQLELTDGFYAWILPNGKPSLLRSHTGPIQSHDSKKYFGLSCLEQGLTLPEVGFWLDICLKRGEVKDEGKTKMLEAEKTSILRLDFRKPMYFFDGIPRVILGIHDV